MKRFGFTDSSGILKSDRFFGTGLLVVKNVGDLGDKLYKNSQIPRSIVKVNKMKAIDNLVAAGMHLEAIKILRGNYRFEMKFDTAGNKSTMPYYMNMVDIFFADPDNRFSAMMIDKQNPAFDQRSVEDAWEIYTKYVAMLVVDEMKRLPSEDELILIVDEISKPANKALSLEDSIMTKIQGEMAKDSTRDFSKVFGALTIESHSNMLMQMCDIFLGAVMYDYKRKNSLSSQKVFLKKEPLVQKLRMTLGVTTLATQFINNSNAYFNVSECV